MNFIPRAGISINTGKIVVREDEQGCVRPPVPSVLCTSPHWRRGQWKGAAACGDPEWPRGGSVSL